MAFKTTDYSYRAYGLTIGSAIPIPDLVVSAGEPDVRISYGELSEGYLDYVTKAGLVESFGCRVRVSEHGVAFHWPQVGKFLIRDGCEVTVELAEGAIENDLLPFLTGPVMVLLLMQRGLLVLHGSSIELDGEATVFIGAQGFGKSTLAACMHVRDHALLSDDVVPVYFSGGLAFTLPGYPRIKLYSDSVEAAGADPAVLPYIHRFINKHSFSTDEVNDAPVPISAVYVLRQADEISIGTLEPAAGLIELIKFTHANHHLKRLSLEQVHFQQCHELAKTVPIFALSRPHSFEAMDLVCSMIEEHTRKASVGKAEAL